MSVLGPEPVGAAAPAPPTAAAAAAKDLPSTTLTEPTPTEVKPAETKPAEAKPAETPAASAPAPTPATHEEPPVVPAVKPAPGMSATSGPLGDEPDFGAEKEGEQPANPTHTPAPDAVPAPTSEEPSVSADKK